MQVNDDSERFEALVREHGKPMLAAARRILRGDEEEARDAVQDALLAAVRSIDSFRAEAQVSTWLFRIVVNAALMRLRAGRRRRATTDDELRLAFDDDARQPSNGGWTAYELLERKRTRQDMRACIDRLPPRHRAIILLRDLEERTTQETADLLAISPCAAKLRLHRARRALRTLLQLSGAPQPAVTASQRAA